MKSSMIMASLVLAAAAGAAQAGNARVDMGRLAGYHTGSGGEFTITTRDAETTNIFGQSYGRTGMFADTANGFQTFCLEVNEFTRDNLRFTVDSYAVRGGAGGVDGTVRYNSGYNTAGYNADNVEDRDSLSEVTQWLYWQFRTGGLATLGANSYDYFNSGSIPGTRASDAGQFQNLMWHLEGEGTAAPAAGSKAAAWLSAAGAAIVAAANNPTDSPWLYQVRVLNVFATSNTNAPGESFDGRDDFFRQSQLTIIPLPTGAALGLAGLSVLAIRRRAAR
jgi:hypothetical protein